MKDILESAKMTLEILGYHIQESEKQILEYLIQKYSSKIIFECAIEEIFGALVYVVADKACADFLRNKIASEEDLKINIPAKEIHIGDVKVSFSEGLTNEEKINLIISKLEREDFNYAPYRKLRW